MAARSENISNLIETVIKYLAFLTIIVTTFFFLDRTSEYFETPKLIALIALTGVLLVLWAIRCVIEGRVTLTKTPLDLPLLLLVITYSVSTFFSFSKSLSVIGSLPRVHGGLASIVLYIILYFVIVSNIRKTNIVKQITYLIVGSGVILGLLSILSYFNINTLGLDLSKAANFTPTGSSFSTISLLLMALPFPLITILRANKAELDQVEKGTFAQEIVRNIGAKTILSIILTIFLTTIVLLSNTPSKDNLLPVGPVVALVIYLLASLTTPQKNLKKNGLFIVFPLIVAVLIGIMSMIPSGKSPLYNYSQNFPRELQLPFSTSWKVSVSAFRDAPFWGSGPSTYLSDFTLYKPIEFNNNKYWNIRFDSAYNEYLQVLATLGAPGLIALLLITIVFLSLAIRALATDQSVLGLSLSLSSIGFFLILALHTSSLVVWVIGVIILACFMLIHKVVTKQVHLGIAATEANSTTPTNLKFEGLQEILLVAVLFLVGAAYFFTGKFALADYHHRNALKAVATGQGIEVYNELIKARELNPYSDLYRTDLAQTNFALANAIAINKGPTEASPAGSLTDQDRQNIQTLLSQAIAEGQAATTINPNNPLNWEILAAIYRQISGVAQNALAFSLDSYGRAIQKDPLNPALRLNIGGIYYAIKNYDLAIRFFTDSINLKSDYANGYYNLAVSLKDKGDIASAIVAAEKTMSLLDPSSADYKTTATLLEDLKKNQETSQAKTTSPTDQTSSALESKNLPKVLDLPTPQKISTPEAVKKPSPTPNK